MKTPPILRQSIERSNVDGLKGEMRCCCWGGFVLGRQVSRKAAEAIFRFEWVEQKKDQMKRSMEEDMLMFRF
ncbi:hypothetical protein Tco_0432238 [Tanacetum coccineum]